MLPLSLILPVFVTVTADAQTATQPQKRELTVYAAASLSGPLQEIAKRLETASPGLDVAFNFGGSQELVRQAEQGAPVDVMALASMEQMRSAIHTGRIDTSSLHVVARNNLVAIAPSAGSQPVTAFSDLGRPGVRIVLAAPAVPAGQYALQLLDRCEKSGRFETGFKEEVLRNVISYEENVRAVLGKVGLGECDAGIVYRTDALSTGGKNVRLIAVPDDLNVTAEYPVAVLKDSPHRTDALQFINELRSNAGRQTLRKYGFTTDSLVTVEPMNH